MAEQTTIHPCWFCAEPSVEEVELYGPEFDTVKGRKILKKNAVSGWVCADHKQRLELNDGWRDRQRAARAARSKALKKDQLSLGDAA